MNRDEPPQSATSALNAAPEPSDISALATLTCQEWVALLSLRRRYRLGQDLWSDHELAHLRFLRWLHETGRLGS